jgi:hypothetical protein
MTRAQVLFTDTNSENTGHSRHFCLGFPLRKGYAASDTRWTRFYGFWGSGGLGL